MYDESFLQSQIARHCNHLPLQWKRLYRQHPHQRTNTSISQNGEGIVAISILKEELTWNWELGRLDSHCPSSLCAA
jgi:hypothetical protein